MPLPIGLLSFGTFPLLHQIVQDSSPLLVPDHDNLFPFSTQLEIAQLINQAFAARNSDTQVLASPLFLTPLSWPHFSAPWTRRTTMEGTMESGGNDAGGLSSSQVSVRR
ncbi:hypothetical protein C8R43DRAFT_1130247 [Mycena crocata]|nr:hypothetical protein C8R43DRAFT_1130247 [Mycena crocata]